MILLLYSDKIIFPKLFLRRTNLKIIAQNIYASCFITYDHHEGLKFYEITELLPQVFVIHPFMPLYSYMHFFHHFFDCISLLLSLSRPNLPHAITHNTPFSRL